MQHSILLYFNCFSNIGLIEQDLGKHHHSLDLSVPSLPIFSASYLVFDFPETFRFLQQHFNFICPLCVQRRAVEWLRGRVSRPRRRQRQSGSRSWTRWRRRLRCWRTVAGSASAPPAPPRSPRCLPCAGRAYTAFTRGTKSICDVWWWWSTIYTY